MVQSVILAVDQSTAGTKAVVFDALGNAVGKASKLHAQLHPQPGWVEHDPEEIWQNTVSVMCDALALSGKTWANVAAIGITNQRETIVCWDRETGKPAANAIVWQDGRAEDFCRTWQSAQDEIRQSTGLQLSPFFSAPKLAWMLSHNSRIAELAKKDALCFGTIESYLLFRMSGGVHKTDATNASRTMLMNLADCRWEDLWFSKFGIPRSAAPEIIACDDVGSTTKACAPIPDGIPIAAIIGDSHAALYGNLCLKPGQSKVTYGTGSSIMMNTGTLRSESTHGLVRSLGYMTASGGPVYCLEGNLNTTGAIIRWLCDQLHLLDSPKDSGRIAQLADPNSGVFFLPALEGLAAPYWRSDVRARFEGLTTASTQADLVRAAEESIAFSIADIIFAMQQELGVLPGAIAADGGAVRDEFLMQTQSDVLGVSLRTGALEEVSARGAAFLAGLRVGLYASESMLESSMEVRQEFRPSVNQEYVQAKYRTWKQKMLTLLAETD